MTEKKYNVRHVSIDYFTSGKGLRNQVSFVNEDGQYNVKPNSEQRTYVNVGEASMNRLTMVIMFAVEPKVTISHALSDSTAVIFFWLEREAAEKAGG